MKKFWFTEAQEPRSYMSNRKVESNQHAFNQELNEYKTIFSCNFPEYLKAPTGPERLLKDFNCSVDKCRFTTDPVHVPKADLVIFYERYVRLNYTRPPNQIYAIFHLESPFHTARMPYPDVFNWTITYRYDSTIPSPYSKWMYFHPDVKQKEQLHNYAANKTKMVAWFVSNCNDKNGRLKYAHDLQEHVGVDIYGSCGNLTCLRENEDQCFDMLDKDYKFYLAFENSNCKEYITEKLFRNALQHNVLPIVMGAPPKDYEKYAPQRSYIHVDDFESPMKLAEYLHELNGNDDMYNAYFQWKGTGEFAKLNHLCDACAMLHNGDRMSTPKWFEDVNKWWNAPGICTRHSWRC
ncbi:glycoprotein 3-alpha-L-fucosyltransferase A-like [Bradysia coprophila]|uniref:glycoprotein 3-alpha-L-fucosyltransferase A-like n=1 Tax=Bradysia coprophila TaxID=38358 RepID=UPI00187DD181|nr:glycoprotein 3-alpha-L-fucosyltransferase A-like [Bradysia coprophila]